MIDPFSIRNQVLSANSLRHLGVKSTKGPSWLPPALEYVEKEGPVTTSQIISHLFSLNVSVSRQQVNRVLGRLGSVTKKRVATGYCLLWSRR